MAPIRQAPPPLEPKAARLHGQLVKRHAPLSREARAIRTIVCHKKAHPQKLYDGTRERDFVRESGIRGWWWRRVGVRETANIFKERHDRARKRCKEP